MSELTDKNYNRILRAFVNSIQDVKDTTKINALEIAIERNDIDAVLTITGMDRSAFLRFEQALEGAFIDGGEFTASQIGRVPLVAGGTALFRFNARDLQAERWIREHSSDLITEVIDDQKQAVRTVLDAGLVRGDNPRTTALDIVGRLNATTRKREGGILGLTSQQAGWVEKAKLELENLDNNYLTRELRDKRFDSVIAKAIEDGKPIPRETVTKAIMQMENRALKYRADTIARTESLNALRAGEYQSIVQAQVLGNVTDRDVIRTWDASGDNRTRDDHMRMEGKQVIGTKTPFVLPDGSRMMYAGDTSLGASAGQVINCRCIVTTKIDFIGKAVRLRGIGA